LIWGLIWGLIWRLICGWLGGPAPRRPLEPFRILSASVCRGARPVAGLARAALWSRWSSRATSGRAEGRLKSSADSVRLRGSKAWRSRGATSALGRGSWLQEEWRTRRRTCPDGRGASAVRAPTGAGLSPSFENDALLNGWARQASPLNKSTRKKPRRSRSRPFAPNQAFLRVSVFFLDFTVVRPGDLIDFGRLRRPFVGMATSWRPGVRSARLEAVGGGQPRNRANATSTLGASLLGGGAKFLSEGGQGTDKGRARDGRRRTGAGEMGWKILGSSPQIRGRGWPERPASRRAAGPSRAWPPGWPMGVGAERG
jgi:hypothetical protein